MASWRAVPHKVKEGSCSIGDDSETYPCALPPGPGGHLESIVPWCSEVRPLKQYCAKLWWSTSCDDGLSSSCELQTRRLRVARGPANYLTVYRRFVGCWVWKARTHLRPSIASFFCFFSPSLMFVEGVEKAQVGDESQRDEKRGHSKAINSAARHCQQKVPHTVLANLTPPNRFRGNYKFGQTSAEGRQLQTVRYM